MVHFHVIHNVKSEGIAKDDVCSCVESSSSCTSTHTRLVVPYKEILTTGKVIEGGYYYLKSSQI